MSETNRPTSRTDKLMNEQLGRRVKLDPEYEREQKIIEHAKDMERENAELREAVIAMAEDGWLQHGPEGMSDAQKKCYAAYLAIKPSNTKEITSE